MKIKDYLDDIVIAFLNNRKPTHEEWTEAEQAMMVQIILFIKRMVSVVEEPKVMDINQSKETGNSQEILAHLDDTQRELAKRISVVEVRGKSTRGLRRVFNILSQQMWSACLYLLETRMDAEISLSNPYVFARCNSSPLYTP